MARPIFGSVAGASWWTAVFRRPGVRVGSDLVASRDDACIGSEPAGLSTLAAVERTAHACRARRLPFPVDDAGVARWLIGCREVAGRLCVGLGPGVFRTGSCIGDDVSARVARRTYIVRYIGARHERHPHPDSQPSTHRGSVRMRKLGRKP